MRKISLIFLGFAMTMACSKTEPNPYDALNQGNDDPVVDTLDPYGFASIHRDIFEAKCAMPACHDGAFEPDFRTPNSAYYSLVYHGVVKNHPEKEFQFRVVPNDTSNSWLWERITTDNDTLGRMPLYAPPLSNSELERIATWINSGAKNTLGEKPSYPNTKPNVLYYAALSPDYQTNYSDNRVNGVNTNPFIAPNNALMKVVCFVEDDSTEIQDFTVNELYISESLDDFSQAMVVNAQFVDLGQNGQYWMADVNTGQFNQGTIYYMRYKVGDGDNPSPTLFPENKTANVYKTYWSFYIP